MPIVLYKDDEITESIVWMIFKGTHKFIVVNSELLAKEYIHRLEEKAFVKYQYNPGKFYYKKFLRLGYVPGQEKELLEKIVYLTDGKVTRLEYR